MRIEHKLKVASPTLAVTVLILLDRHHFTFQGNSYDTDGSASNSVHSIGRYIVAHHGSRTMLYCTCKVLV